MLRDVDISRYNISTSGDLVIEYADGVVDVVSYTADLEKNILNRIKTQIKSKAVEYSKNKKQRKKHATMAAALVAATAVLGGFLPVATVTAAGFTIVPVLCIAALGGGAISKIIDAARCNVKMNELKKPLLFARNIDKVNDARARMRARGIVNSQTSELKVTDYDKYTTKEVKKLITDAGVKADSFLCPVQSKVESVKQKVKCR